MPEGLFMIYPEDAGLILEGTQADAPGSIDEISVDPNLTTKLKESRCRIAQPEARPG